MPPRNKVKNGYEASLYDFSFTEPILRAHDQCFFFLYFYSLVQIYTQSTFI